MKPEDMEIYRIAMEIGDEIWFSAIGWENLAKYSVGPQIIKSSDSIETNISEGFGRYHFKDRRQFMIFTGGSLYETKTWIQKAKNRNLVPEFFFKTQKQRLESLGVKLNNYISTLNAKSI